MKRLPLLSLRRSDQNYEAVVREYLQGTYQSSWNFLVQAARSNLIHTAVEASRLTDISIRAVKRDQRPAETLLVMNYNYSSQLAGHFSERYFQPAVPWRYFSEWLRGLFSRGTLPNGSVALGSQTSYYKRLLNSMKNRFLINRTSSMIRLCTANAIMPCAENSSIW